MSACRMLGRLLYAVATGLPLAAALSLPAPAATDADPQVAILAEQGIEPESDAIFAYLQGLRPSDADRRVIASLILQLGHDSYAKRAAAVRQLVAMPVVPVAELRAAAEYSDGEVGLRAGRVLAARAGGNAGSVVTVACFRTIAKRKLTGVGPAILDVLPLYAEEAVLAAGREALRATTGPGDATMLRQAAHGTNASRATESRAAAVAALATVLGDDARPDLAALLADADPRVRLAATRALADRGDRACLAPLVESLSSADARVRQGAIATLRALTGRTSDYAAWLDPDAQAPVIAAWQQWLAHDARLTELRHPLRSTDGGGDGGVEFGRTLICLYAKNEIVENNAAGNQTFAAAEPGACPWACQGLPTGGRLVALYSANVLVEYGADGKERVRIPVPGGPMSVQRLDNGNTLVACNNAQRVVEVNDDGKVVWEAALGGGPCDAVRLDNGRTLVTLQNANAVIEIDASGKEHWRVEGLHTPRTASRLENGNTLICDLGVGRIVELDAAGNEAWGQSGFSSPFCAQRLSSGATLVSDTEGVKEVDREGRVIGETKLQSLGRVFRY